MGDRSKSERADKPDKGERPEKLDVPQGTLELMILTILTREPMHGGCSCALISVGIIHTSLRNCRPAPCTWCRQCPRRQ